MLIITRKVEQSLGVTVTNRLLGPNWFTAALTSKRSLALMSEERSAFEFKEHLVSLINEGLALIEEQLMMFMLMKS